MHREKRRQGLFRVFFNMGTMGFHGGEGWMPPAAAWAIGERPEMRDALPSVAFLVSGLSPIAQSVGNADGLQPCCSLSPCLRASL